MRYGIRAAGIIVEDHTVLMAHHVEPGYDFWTLPAIRPTSTSHSVPFRSQGLIADAGLVSVESKVRCEVSAEDEAVREFTQEGVMWVVRRPDMYEEEKSVPKN